MPLRAVSYADAAFRIAKVVPIEQIQIIHANNLGSKVNGINMAHATKQAELLATMTRIHMSVAMPEMHGRVLHAEDTELDLEPFIALSQSVLQCDSDQSTKLSTKGTKHGGDSQQYAAAHCAFQDTDRLALRPLLLDSPEQVSAQRILSVGCQQERLFYMARMAMREVAPESIELVPTSQVFTKHVSPPYFMARGGEQTLEHAMLHGVNLDLTQDVAAHRDLRHLQNNLLNGEYNE